MLELSLPEPAAAPALHAVTTLFRPSQAKLSILAQLSRRPMTATEIGRSLKVDKAAAFRHLNALVASGLVERQGRSKRRWVYYRLSPTTAAHLEQARLRLPPTTPKPQKAFRKDGGQWNPRGSDRQGSDVRR